MLHACLYTQKNFSEDQKSKPPYMIRDITENNKKVAIFSWSVLFCETKISVRVSFNNMQMYPITTLRRDRYNLSTTKTKRLWAESSHQRCTKTLWENGYEWSLNAERCEEMFRESLCLLYFFKLDQIWCSLCSKSTVEILTLMDDELEQPFLSFSVLKIMRQRNLSGKKRLNTSLQALSSQTFTYRLDIHSCIGWGDIAIWCM